MPEIKKIQYGGQTIELPAGMTLEEAKAQMARFFPELSEPKIETKKDGDQTTYVFSKQTGRKGTLNYCPICGDNVWPWEHHKCKPRFEFCLDGDGDEWRKVFARDEKEAAEKAAEKVWDYEYHNQILVWVRKPEATTTTLYPVNVEMVPQFNAESEALLKDGKYQTRQLEAEPEEE